MGKRRFRDYLGDSDKRYDLSLKGIKARHIICLIALLAVYICAMAAENLPDTAFSRIVNLVAAVFVTGFMIVMVVALCVLFVSEVRKIGKGEDGGQTPDSDLAPKELAPKEFSSEDFEYDDAPEPVTRKKSIYEEKYGEEDIPASVKREKAAHAKNTAKALAVSYALVLFVAIVLTVVIFVLMMDTLDIFDLI